MSYAEANKMIQNHVAENGGAKANPMIVYALDSQFFPDDLYQELCDDREGNRLPIEYPWLIGLFWIRRFMNSVLEMTIFSVLETEQI